MYVHISNGQVHTDFQVDSVTRSPVRFLDKAFDSHQLSKHFNIITTFQALPRRVADWITLGLRL